MKNTTELKKLTNVELESELLTLRKQQFNLRMKRSNGTLDKPHLVKLVRRAIARIKTIMTENAGKSHV